MDIDLKWLLPFVLPFAISAMVSVLMWFVGAEYSQEGRSMNALFSLIVGFVLGACVAAIMQDNGKTITIRKIMGGK